MHYLPDANHNIANYIRQNLVVASKKKISIYPDYVMIIGYDEDPEKLGTFPDIRAYKNNNDLIDLLNLEIRTQRLNDIFSPKNGPIKYKLSDVLLHTMEDAHKYLTKKYKHSYKIVRYHDLTDESIKSLCNRNSIIRALFNMDWIDLIVKE